MQEENISEVFLVMKEPNSLKNFTGTFLRRLCTRRPKSKLVTWNKQCWKLPVPTDKYDSQNYANNYNTGISSKPWQTWIRSLVPSSKTVFNWNRFVAGPFYLLCNAFIHIECLSILLRLQFPTLYVLQHVFKTLFRNAYIFT